MPTPLLYCAGKTAAARYAAWSLAQSGVRIAQEPGKDVRHVLLDVPSFDKNGNLRSGGSLEALLKKFSPDVTVFGGNLEGLEFPSRVDFLKDPLYQAENAYITAECTLEIALERLPRTIRGCPVLIVGWGRIGRCLSKLLTALGADVAIAARKESDRALSQALGYRAEDIPDLTGHLSLFRLLINTVPAPILPQEAVALCGPDCVKIELASRTGLEGEDIVVARGLPGTHMPESSGQLIARTSLRLRKEVL